MATMEDLQDVLTSVDTSIKEQTGILKSMFLLQLSEASHAAAERERARAARDTPMPIPSVPPPVNPDTSEGGNNSNNTLSGLLGGLTALFGADILGRFSFLAKGAAALAITVGVTIGTISGQMKAIDAYFKLFGADLPKIFNNFKNSITNTFVNIAEDLKVRAAFIRVSIVETFDNFAKNIKSLFALSGDSSFSKIMTGIKSGLAAFIEPFKTALVTIQELASTDGPPSKISGLLSTISGWFGEIGSRIARIAGVVGKLFAPIAIIMTAFDTVKGALDGYAEGGILGGLKGAIDGFFTSLVTIPLDLIKNMVTWVVDKLGFDETASVLREFSFTDLWKQITGSIFDGIKGAWNSIKESFSFGEEDKNAIGVLGKLTDIVYAPVNMAINFVKGIFGFKENEEPFKMQDWIITKAAEIFDWVGGILTEKFQSFGNYVASIPEKISIAAQDMWLRLKTKVQLGFLELAEWISSIPKKILAMVVNLLSNVKVEIPDNMATRALGIAGASWRLIDEETVNAANQNAQSIDTSFAARRAEIQANSFIERSILEDRIKKLEEQATSTSAPVVLNYSPNISPINQSFRGGDTQSQINSYGGGGNRDLSYGSIPGGVGQI